MRLDGKMDSKEILAAMMRRAFAPFNAIQMSRQVNARGTTGQSNEAMRIQSRLQQRKGMVLTIGPACVFDGMGQSGIWDKIHSVLGARGATPNNCIPWKGCLSRYGPRKRSFYNTSELN